ncbi:hypothetical protein B0T25DRAFT_563735 [Lasiosphaeria hispida]|uniref:Uncharacterized protein n=1 Tax=Lasiosphaeria hispida TaxID=260671 RepID=A0AAJ0MGX2_9PEZI|nr:hypothetical protein B0T25DRAFT_563735 [Lasiosphaeria hispida]
MYGINFRLFILLKTEHHGMASATPAHNQVTDWQAYANVMYRTSGLAKLLQLPISRDVDSVLVSTPKCPKHDQGRKDLDATTTEILQQHQQFTVNRGMNTPVILPNGQVIFPIDNIPAMQIMSVELAHGTLYKTLIDKTNAILANIATKSTSLPQIDFVTEEGLGKKNKEGKPKTRALSLGLIHGLHITATWYPG